MNLSDITTGDLIAELERRRAGLAGSLAAVDRALDIRNAHSSRDAETALQVAQAVAAVCGLESPRALLERTRMPQAAIPRMLLHYILRTHHQWSYTRIGTATRRTHMAIMHSVRKVAAQPLHQITLDAILRRIESTKH